MVSLPKRKPNKNKQNEANLWAKFDNLIDPIISLQVERGADAFSPQEINENLKTLVADLKTAWSAKDDNTGYEEDFKVLERTIDGVEGKHGYSAQQKEALVYDYMSQYVLERYARVAIEQFFQDVQADAKKVDDTKQPEFVKTFQHLLQKAGMWKSVRSLVLDIKYDTQGYLDEETFTNTDGKKEIRVALGKLSKNVDLQQKMARQMAAELQLEGKLDPLEKRALILHFCAARKALTASGHDFDGTHPPVGTVEAYLSTAYQLHELPKGSLQELFEIVREERRTQAVYMNSIYTQQAKQVLNHPGAEPNTMPTKAAERADAIYLQVQKMPEKDQQSFYKFLERREAVYKALQDKYQTEVMNDRDALFDEVFSNELRVTDIRTYNTPDVPATKHREDARSAELKAQPPELNPNRVDIPAEKVRVVASAYYLLKRMATRLVASEEAYDNNFTDASLVVLTAGLKGEIDTKIEATLKSDQQAKAQRAHDLFRRDIEYVVGGTSDAFLLDDGHLPAAARADAWASSKSPWLKKNKKMKAILALSVVLGVMSGLAFAGAFFMGLLGTHLQTSLALISPVLYPIVLGVGVACAAFAITIEIMAMVNVYKREARKLGQVVQNKSIVPNPYADRGRFMRMIGWFKKPRVAFEQTQVQHMLYSLRGPDGKLRTREADTLLQFHRKSNTPTGLKAKFFWYLVIFNALATGALVFATWSAAIPVAGLAIAVATLLAVNIAAASAFFNMAFVRGTALSFDYRGSMNDVDEHKKQLLLDGTRDKALAAKGSKEEQDAIDAINAARGKSGKAVRRFLRSVWRHFTENKIATISGLLSGAVVGVATMLELLSLQVGLGLLVPILVVTLPAAMMMQMKVGATTLAMWTKAKRELRKSHNESLENAILSGKKDEKSWLAQKWAAFWPRASLLLKGVSVSLFVTLTVSLAIYFAGGQTVAAGAAALTLFAVTFGMTVANFATQYFFNALRKPFEDSAQHYTNGELARAKKQQGEDLTPDNGFSGKVAMGQNAPTMLRQLNNGASSSSSSSDDGVKLRSQKVANSPDSSERARLLATP